MDVTVVLGPEYDARLHEALRQVLRGMGATIGPTTWGVAGSQELSTWDAVVHGQSLRIESETYMGLSITGECELVHTIAASMKERTG